MANVTIYTGPYCPYCNMAKQFLKQQGVEEYEEIRIDQYPGAMAEMQARSGRRTIPQIFIGQTHVGGFTDLYALHERGELDALLQQSE